MKSVIITLVKYNITLITDLNIVSNDTRGKIFCSFRNNPIVWLELLNIFLRSSSKIYFSQYNHSQMLLRPDLLHWIVVKSKWKDDSYLLDFTEILDILVFLEFRNVLM